MSDVLPTFSSPITIMENLSNGLSINYIILLIEFNEKRKVPLFKLRIEKALIRGPLSHLLKQIPKKIREVHSRIDFNSRENARKALFQELDTKEEITFSIFLTNDQLAKSIEQEVFLRLY